MTEKEFLKLSKTKQDALIAKHIFSIETTPVRYIENDEDTDNVEPVNVMECGFPLMMEYTTDISAAWEVVEKIRDMFGSIQITQQKVAYVEVMNLWDGNILVSNDSTSLAICIAALKDKGVIE
jgi:hypothetical protein